MIRKLDKFSAIVQRIRERTNLHDQLAKRSGLSLGLSRAKREV